MKGTNCNHEMVEFVAHLAAPGFGQSWICLECGEPMWKPNAAAQAIPFKELDTQDYILSPEDVV